MIDFATVKGVTIPEGAVKQFTDIHGNVLWKEPPAGVTVTITGSGLTYACVVIDGVTYNTEATVVVPIGTVITCATNGDNSSSSIIRANYQTVVYAENATYDYTVVSDATITLSTPLHNTASSFMYGLIEIVDVNAPNGATVDITVSGVTTGSTSGGVTIDGVTYGTTVSIGVPLGTVVVCRAIYTSHYMYGSFGGQIKLNGTLVADRGSGVNPTTYEYTVNKDVKIDLVGVGSPNGVFRNINIIEQ